MYRNSDIHTTPFVRNYKLFLDFLSTVLLLCVFRYTHVQILTKAMYLELQGIHISRAEGLVGARKIRSNMLVKKKGGVSHGVALRQVRSCAFHKIEGLLLKIKCRTASSIINIGDNNRE